MNKENCETVMKLQKIAYWTSFCNAPASDKIRKSPHMKLNEMLELYCSDIGLFISQKYEEKTRVSKLFWMVRL